MDARVEIRVRDDGPYKVTGPVRIVDPEGNELLAPDPDRPVVLCRCGQSRTKPFCDAAHRSSGFSSCVRAAKAARAEAPGGEAQAAPRAGERSDG